MLENGGEIDEEQPLGFVGLFVATVGCCRGFGSGYRVVVVIVVVVVVIVVVVVVLNLLAFGPFGEDFIAEDFGRVMKDERELFHSRPSQPENATFTTDF